MFWLPAQAKCYRAGERLVKEVVVKTDGWQGYSFLDALPYRDE